MKEKMETTKTLSEIEDDLEKLLALLPETPKKKELTQRIIEAEEAELPGILIEMQEMIARRDELKKLLFRDFPEEENFCDFKDKEKLDLLVKQRLLQVVEEIEKKKLQKLGEGSTAAVYHSETCPEYCYKVIYNPEKYRGDLTVKEEMAFMDELSNFEFAGVRSPKPYYYRMNKEAHILVMETLDAVSIADVTRAENPEPLPENFDYETFISGLEQYLHKLHEQGIHHRDLHDGNVMIDRKTGLGYVIDFGRAIKLHLGSEENPYDLVNLDGVTRLTADLEQLKNHKEILKRFKNKS